MRTSPLPAHIEQKSPLEQLDFLLSYQPPRGDFDELLMPPDALKRYEGFEAAADCELLAALRQVDSLIAAGTLPRDDIVWQADKTGHSIGCEVYGYAGALTLVQVRHVTRIKGAGRSQQRLRYVVTDGHILVDVSPLRIKPACEKDPSPASPVHAVRSSLPKHWQSQLRKPIIVDTAK